MADVNDVKDSKIDFHEDSVATKTYSDGSVLEIYYCNVRKKLFMDVSVKRGSFLGIGFGNDMTDTEIGVWHAYDDGTYVFDTWWGYTEAKPSPAPQFESCYNTEPLENPFDDNILLSTSRELECDVEDSFVV